MFKWLSVLLTFFLTSSHALLTEDLYLLQIAGNTAQQLNELEDLITSAEKHTKVLREMNEIAEDKIYLAERIELWATDMNYIFVEGDGDLGDLNDSIRNLKIKKAETLEIYKDLIREEKTNDKTISNIKRNQTKQKTNLKRYKAQALRSPRKSNGALKQISQNTSAQLYESAKTNALVSETNKEIARLNQTLVTIEKRKIEKEEAQRRKLKEL